jgi:hypothetical protein
MRGAAVVFGTLITVTIALGTQAAMSAELRKASDRVAERESVLQRVLDPVWYGGELPPIVVEVAPVKGSQAPSTAARMAPRPRTAPAQTGVTARIS